jgi:hypothetical protein
VPIKSLTFTASTKKLWTKLSYEKATRKMLVKLTPGVTEPEISPTCVFTAFGKLLGGTIVLLPEIPGTCNIPLLINKSSQ